MQLLEKTLIILEVFKDVVAANRTNAVVVKGPPFRGVKNLVYPRAWVEITIDEAVALKGLRVAACSNIKLW